MNFSYESNLGSSCPNLSKLSSRVPRKDMVASKEGSLRAPSVLGSKSQKNSEKILFGGNPPLTLGRVPAPAVVEVRCLIKLRCAPLLQVGVDVAHDALGVAYDDAVVGHVLADEGVRTDDNVIADDHALKDGRVHADEDVVSNLHTPGAAEAVVHALEDAPVVAVRQDGHSSSNRYVVANLNHPGTRCVNHAVLRGVDDSVITNHHTKRLKMFDIVLARSLRTINQLLELQSQVHCYALFLKLYSTKSAPIQVRHQP